jgi:hypothetical protein
MANMGRRQGVVFTRLAGRTTVPPFILVPQARVRKRLDPDGAAQKQKCIAVALPWLVTHHWRSAA